MKLKLLPFLSAAILAIASTAASAASIDTQVPGSDTNSVPCTPKQRTDDYHVNHFNEDISKSQGQEFDIVLFGDSITDFWNSNPNLSLDNNPTDTKTFNMGIGSDRVQNILWRLRNGALDGYTTKYLTLMIGINNGHQKCIDHNEHADRPEDVAESIRLMLKEMATRQPDAKILLMPILPYSFDSRYFEAAEVTAMSEAVNDYILQFVDNKRIFWIDLRGKYLNQDSTPNKVCYREGGHGGYDAVGLCLHPEFFTYSDFWKPAITNAMHKYLSGDVGVSHVAEPSIGYAKAAPNADGAGSATITVHGIFLGTDANANPVATYSIDYELDGGAKTRALSNQSLTRNSFVIPNVSLGQHTCRVTVTTADDKELVTVLDFTMTEPWFASPLPTDDSSVRTNGTLEYAYAPDACTVNGVSFTKANGSIDDANISWPYGSTSGASAPSSTTGAYHDLLNHCWWANQGDKPVTLKNLTPGRSYLVQIFGYRNYNNDSKAHVWIKESYWDPNFIKVYGDGWACGGTLTGTFTATAATKTFTITSDGNYGINGIQVRDLGESGAAVVVQPSIGSVSATTNGTAATVFLSGIALGTDDAGESATSYSVSYSLNGAAAVASLSGQTAATASFVLPNLADGEYTCAVTITSDANKTSASKSVSFRIGPPPPEVVEPFIGSSSVTTNGTTATIALSEITMGTDDAGAAASSYSVSYAMNGGSAVTALSNQSGATASFDIEDLADGRYTCVVTVTTDKNKTAETTVSFRIGEPPPITVGWTVGPMSADGSTIRTDGDLLYAYAAQNGTVGGVSFVRDAPLGAAGMVSASPQPAMGGGSWGTDDAPGDFGTMLQNGWNWTGDGTELSYTLTLAGLTPGKNYLVQLFMHRQSDNMLVSVNGSAQAHLHGADEEHYKYGASIVGLFTASAATQDITVTYTERGGDRPLNAIQVRYLGDGGGATVVAPSIESVVATTNGTTATIALSGVVMGTDNLGTNATSYAVSYVLNGGAAVAALANQSGATASFDIANLADGSYTCEVTITTDKNKTASKSVSFTIGTPPPDVVEPSIGSVVAETSGSNATVSLSGIVLGTDDEGVAATSYAVSYALNGGAAVAALANQTGSTASFDIEDLADGSYTCEVTITTDKNKSATKSVSFAISTSGGGGGGSAEEGWTGEAADAEGTVFRTDGTLLYAYAVSSVTVNGIAFAADADLNTADTAVSPDLAQTDGNSGSESVTGDFGTMLKNSWEWANTTSTLAITLKGLTAGNRYLVQLLAHNKWSDTLISAGDLTPMAMRDINKYGASLVCVFDATGETEDIAVKYSGPAGWRVLNAIQVRDLGEGGGATVVAPSIGSAAAEVNGSTATISLSGVVMGTDDEGTNATSYAVSYSLNGGAAVTALQDQSGATASFDIGNLADGDYTCLVSITTDKNKTSAEKPVSFTIGTTPPPVVAPSIGAVSAAVSGSNATVSLSGIVLGTDDEGAAASSYAVSYALNGGTAVAALANQTAATASFQIADLADGAYACAVTITTDKGKTASKTVSFTIDTAGGGGDAGWTAQAMDDAGAAFSTEGNLAYAYALQQDVINGIVFAKANPIVVSDSIAFEPNYAHHNGNLGNEDVSNTAFGLMLGNAWCWTNTPTMTLKLKDLTPGHKYLVQILSHKTGSGMLVSAGGCEPEHINGYGALLTGVFTALAATQDVEIAFSNVSNPTSDRPVNAVQVRDLGVDFIPVVDPSIGTLSAALSGPTAVIVLGDVEMGTDDEGVAATSYAVAYALDGGDPVEKLWNQTGWSAWFNVTNLADGAHTVEVTVATDAGGVASKSVSFTVDSTAPATSAWIVEPMSMSGDTIRTEGDLLYAEAPNLAVVNGVRFERTLWVSDASFTVSPAPADVLWSGMGNEGFNNEANAYGFLLTHAWFWDKSATNTAATVTLTGLTPGKNYLVQLVSHNQYTDTMTVSAEGTEPKPVGTRSHVENQSPTLPWRYGASLVGFFTASDTTQEFTVQWDGAEGCHPLNALQVRDLGLAVPVVVEPSIGAASATVDDDSKTAFVTLSGVVKGTDDACNPAASYDVSYALDGGDSVLALKDRTGATAAFSIKNLADGLHECVVTITTDAGKSASATVSFTIKDQTPPWIVEPMTEDGDTIRTNGVRRWAFCVGEDIGTLVANGVQFTTFKNLDATRLGGLEIQMPFSVSPAIDSAVDGWGTEGVADAGYAQILDRAFYNGASGEYTFTINGNLSALKAGRRYLVQIIMHRNGSTATATVSGFDVDHVQFGGTGWTYGGSLIGTFVPTSDREDHTFKVKFEGGDFAAINAIQLRDLGPAVPTEEDPSIETVSGKRKAASATVTLSGVVMGTDSDFHPATSYAVSYRLDGGAWTTVLPSENGETASFELTGLEYRTYVCEVKIETDVGKSTEPQAVTLAFAKADGLAIVLFDVEKETLAFDMGSESSVRAMLPDATDIYCTLVTSTNLADVVWTPALPSLAWKANELPLDDDSGWTWVGVDTADAVRFFRVALTPAPLAADDEVVFK